MGFNLVQVINEALVEFGDTAEAARVVLAESELAVNRGDIQGAFKTLRKVKSDSPYFMKARVAAANLYLEQKKDKISYIKCYLELLVGKK